MTTLPPDPDSLPLSKPMLAQSRQRRWLRISLRVLMLAVIVIACVLARVANHARCIHEAAEALSKAGGFVVYDWQFTATGGISRAAKPPGASWLGNAIGREYFEGVKLVSLSGANAMMP